jgi:adenylosuccinate synthase
VELGPKTLAAIEAHKAARAFSDEIASKMKGLGQANVEAHHRVQELTEKLVDNPSLLDEWREVMVAHKTSEDAWQEVKQFDWKAVADQKGAFYNMLQTFIEEHVPHIPKAPHIPENVEKLDT